MAFGGVWKASLTELSGGQRSLLALSLILAMLLFKPAPIYILDEARALAVGSQPPSVGTYIVAVAQCCYAFIAGDKGNNLIADFLCTVNAHA